MARVVIIGAGLTGLSVAHHLEQQDFFDYALFEQESAIGGLCRSVRTNGFTFDYTGHFFHCINRDILLQLQTIMRQAPLISNMRRSYIYSHETYTPYPYQTNLYGLPTQTIIDCITGFVHRKRFAKTNNFASWVNTHFGKGFAEHFFFPYQEKIFDFPVTKLKTGWVNSVPQTTLEDVLNGALQKRDIHSIGYNAQFWYPKQGGIDHLINCFAHTLKNQIYTNYSANHIDLNKKIVTFSNGHTEHYDQLVSTIPLTRCLHLIGNHTEAKKLLCNSVININLGINRDNLCQKHWVYYPEKQYHFFRIGYPSTLRSMAPNGYSSMSIEIASLPILSDARINTLTQKAIQQVRKIFGLSMQEIITQQTLILPHAYVIYDAWREKHIDTLLENLAKKSVYSIGRYGAWKYSSMYDAIVDGQSTATKLTTLFATHYTPACHMRTIIKQAPIITNRHSSKKVNHV